jgi:hypothetical protein
MKDASKLKLISFVRNNSRGYAKYFTYESMLFVVEYSHEVNDEESEGLDYVINEMTDNQFNIIFLEDSNIWTGERSDLTI